MATQNIPGPAPAGGASQWIMVGVSGGGGREVPVVSPHDGRVMLLTSDMGSIHRSRDRGRTWQMLPMSEILACATCRPIFHPRDPQVIYGGNGYRGLLKVSRDGGDTWQFVGQGLPEGVCALAIDPARPELMLAGVCGWPKFESKPAHRSCDAGATWTPVTGLEGQVLEFHVDLAAPKGSPRLFAGTPSGVLRSSDEGASWQTCGPALAEGETVGAFAAASSFTTGERRLYCWVRVPGDAGESRFLRSDDGAQTWSEVGRVPAGPGGEPTWLLVSQARPSRVYAVKGVSSWEDTVWRSDDAGATWTPKFFCKFGDHRFNAGGYIVAEQVAMWIRGWSITMGGIDPNDPDFVMFADYAAGFTSEDGGETWRCQDAVEVPAGTPLAIDVHWKMLGLGITSAWQYAIDPRSPQHRYMCLSDMALWHSHDQGETWQWFRHFEPNCYEVALDPQRDGILWGAFSRVHDIPSNNPIIGYHPQTGPGCVGRSDDYGRTWRRAEGVPNAPVLSVLIDPDSPTDRRRLFAAVWEHGVFVSNDDGQTWVPSSKGLGAPGRNMRCCRLRRHADGTLYCLITGKREGSPEKYGGPPIREGVGLYRSRDGGKQWEDLTTGLAMHWPTDFAVDPADSGSLWLGVADWPGVDQVGGLYRTTDAGRAWRLVTRKSHRHFGVSFHPRRPGWMYMCLHASSPEIAQAHGAGLWFSRDAGEHWEPITALPFVRVSHVDFDPENDDVIYVCTYGGGVWRGPARPS
ncbi:MAG: hypothetical protein K8S99_01430 [Planctomycetes bacterium]|nr:hypothetical protein [Planctomycetota bacterium]